MAVQVSQLVRSHGALAALVTAGGVVAVIVAQQLLNGVVSWVSVVPYLSDGSYSPTPFTTVTQAAVVALPFGIGFFLSLWLVGPIAAELGLPHVVTRAILACGIGATILFIVRAVIAVIAAFWFGGPLFGNSFPFPQFDGGNAVSGLGSALVASLLTLISVLPLGVLAGVLLWLWRKDHPPKHPISGLIDV